MLKGWLEHFPNLHFVLPVWLLVYFLVAIRGDAPPENIYFPVVTAVCCWMWVTKKYRRLSMFLAISIFAMLLLTYLIHAKDLRYVLRVGLFYVVPWIFFKGLIGNSIGSARVFFMALIVGSLVDLNYVSTFLKDKTSVPVRADFRGAADNSLSIFPYGISSKPIGVQSIRHPELIQRQFNFLGSRYVDCQKIGFDKNKVCSDSGTASIDSIWSPFFLTADFVRIYDNPGVARIWSHLSTSFRQGLDQDGLEFRPRPLCDQKGYLFIGSVSGHYVEFAVADPDRKPILLPLFKSHQKVSILGASSVSHDDFGFVKIDLHNSFEVLRVEEAGASRVVVVLFWLPSLVLVFGLIGLYGRKILSGVL